MKLQLLDVTKQLGGQKVVRGLHLNLQEGDMLVLLGPSGCGKTTTLRLIAGLLHPDAGAIVLDGHTIATAGKGWPPERRNLGMVFQSYAVWPHKTVFENVAYGLQLRRTPREEIRRRVQEALDLVHLRDTADRYPSEISGGQQQRVALARAIVVKPSLLLLDEPLSNLDATLREQMRIELKVLQRQIKLTSVYVTHDQAEAMVLADHLVVMRNGRIEQEGPAEEVYLRPRSRFVAGFLGVTNLLPGRINRTERGEGWVDIPGLGMVGAFLADEVRAQLTVGDPACVSFRPMGLALSNAPPAVSANAFEGRIVQRIFLGEVTEYVIQTGETRWRVHVDSAQAVDAEKPIWIRVPHTAGSIVVDA